MAKKKHQTVGELPAEFKRFNELVEYVRSKEMDKANGVHVPDVKIAELAGYNAPAFSMMKNNKDKKVCSYMPNAAKNLCAHYPECSLEYVLEGKGKLIKEEEVFPPKAFIIEEEPDSLEIPEYPEIPDSPDSPEEPDTPEEPEIPDTPAKPMTAREKWELAAAEYNLEFDPDGMMAKDSEGLIHLFTMNEEEKSFIQEVYPKGTKIKDMGTTSPAQLITYKNDVQVFSVSASFTLNSTFTIEASSEMEAVESVRKQIMDIVATQLQLSECNVEHINTEIVSSQIKK